MAADLAGNFMLRRLVTLATTMSTPLADLALARALLNRRSARDEAMPRSCAGSDECLRREPKPGFTNRQVAGMGQAGHIRTLAWRSDRGGRPDEQRPRSSVPGDHVGPARHAEQARSARKKSLF